MIVSRKVLVFLRHLTRRIGRAIGLAESYLILWRGYEIDQFPSRILMVRGGVYCKEFPTEKRFANGCTVPVIRDARHYRGIEVDITFLQLNAFEQPIAGENEPDLAVEERVFDTALIGDIAAGVMKQLVGVEGAYGLL